MRRKLRTKGEAVCVFIVDYMWMLKVNNAVVVESDTDAKTNNTARTRIRRRSDARSASTNWLAISQHFANFRSEIVLAHPNTRRFGDLCFFLPNMIDDDESHYVCTYAWIVL